MPSTFEAEPQGSTNSSTESDLRARIIKALNHAASTNPCTCGSTIFSSCHHEGAPSPAERRADAVLAVLSEPIPADAGGEPFAQPWDRCDCGHFRRTHREAGASACMVRSCECEAFARCLECGHPVTDHGGLNGLACQRGGCDCGHSTGLDDLPIVDPGHFYLERGCAVPGCGQPRDSHGSRKLPPAIWGCTCGHSIQEHDPGNGSCIVREGDATSDYADDCTGFNLIPAAANPSELCGCGHAAIVHTSGTGNCLALGFTDQMHSHCLEFHAMERTGPDDLTIVCATPNCTGPHQCEACGHSHLDHTQFGSCNSCGCTQDQHDPDGTPATEVITWGYRVTYAVKGGQTYEAILPGHAAVSAVDGVLKIWHPKQPVLAIVAVRPSTPEGTGSDTASEGDSR